MLNKVFIKIFILVITLFCVSKGFFYYLDQYHVFPEATDEDLIFVNLYTLCASLGVGLMAWIIIESIHLISSRFNTVCDVIKFEDSLNFLRVNFFWMAVLAVHVCFLFASIFLPKVFLQWSYEDCVVETLSAVFLILASGILLKDALTVKMRNNSLINMYNFIFLMMALVFFVVAMEEVSWMQRTFDIQTPEMFSANDQGEMNFHNLATDFTTEIYYFGQFFAFVIVPFVVYTFSAHKRSKFISAFVPSRFVMLVACVALAYNGNLWNFWIDQLVYFLAFFILIRKDFLPQNVKGRKFVYVFGIFYILSEVIFEAFANNSWSIEAFPEYREFFIALSCLVYAWEVVQRKLSSVEAGVVA